MSTTPLKVRLYGESCLRNVSETVESIGPAERMLISMMMETMKAYHGIGLAAPQVGINQQIFVAEIDEIPTAFINPKVVSGDNPTVMEEGCLSIPDVQIKVKRPSTISVEYTDIDNKTVRRDLNKLNAKVFQHELDHLHGKLITDYMSIPEKLKYKSTLKEFEQRKERLVEPKNQPEKE